MAHEGTDLAEIWTRAIARIDSDAVHPHQRAWISLTRPLGLIEGTALLAAPNEFAKEYLEKRMRSMLAALLAEELGHDVNVVVTVAVVEDPEAEAGPKPPRGDGLGNRGDGLGNGSADRLSDPPGNGVASRLGPGLADGFDAERDLRTERSAAAAGRPGAGDDGGWRQQELRAAPTRSDLLDRASAAGPGSAAAGGPDARYSRDSRLNPKYTFDTFVIGASNRFPHAAAVAVAEAPARAYNPLFIYGDSGLGKTHLLHAIGHYAHRLFPGLRVRYVSSEEFTNEFINSLRDDKMQAFQRRYREVDILLIDDIQFLERAERTQEEFFHTFNTLHNANKQIVISSDRSPRQLTTLEDRLRTRFEWGLITDVHAPDLETRIAILRKKAAQDALDPPPEVLEFIATKIQANIRELEGALIRVTAFAGLNHQPVDLTLTEAVLKDLISESDRPEITAAVIMAATADYFQVSLDDLAGVSRRRDLVGPRQIAMYLCRELTELSLPRIGAAFGGRDHTTVLHAERKIRRDMTEQHTVYNQVAELTSRIRARAGQ